MDENVFPMAKYERVHARIFSLLPIGLFKKYRLTEPYVFRNFSGDLEFTIPKGYTWDGMSFFWTDDENVTASLVHDYWYRHKPDPNRWMADFYLSMIGTDHGSKLLTTRWLAVLFDPIFEFAWDQDLGGWNDIFNRNRRKVESHVLLSHDR